MIEIIYRYHVHPSQARAFEHAYGPAGPWSRLFAAYPGFRRTRLFHHRARSEFYLTVDVWDSKAAYDAFRDHAASEYARLDRELRMLYVEELLLGYYEGDDEYQASSSEQGTVTE
jgi:heme-degrading monooxygenase HmoA